MGDSTELPAWPERAEPSMLAYSALFGITYIASAFALGMLLRLAPPQNHSSGSSVGHLLVLGAALLTGWVFVKRHKRLFTPSENLRLVGFCAVWVLALKALALLSYAPRLGALPNAAIVGVLVFAVALDVLIVWAVFRHGVRRMMQNRVPGTGPSNTPAS